MLLVARIRGAPGGGRVSLPGELSGPPTAAPGASAGPALPYKAGGGAAPLPGPRPSPVRAARRARSAAQPQPQREPRSAEPAMGKSGEPAGRAARGLPSAGLPDRAVPESRATWTPHGTPGCRMEGARGKVPRSAAQGSFWGSRGAEMAESTETGGKARPKRVPLGCEPEIGQGGFPRDSGVRALRPAKARLLLCFRRRTQLRLEKDPKL